MSVNDFDAGVIGAALDAASRTAGTAAPLPRCRSRAGKVDGVLICRQPDSYPFADRASTRDLLTHLHHNALWAPTIGATYLVVVAADDEQWIAGILDNGSAGATLLSEAAIHTSEAAGLVTV